MYIQENPIFKFYYRIVGHGELTAKLRILA